MKIAVVTANKALAEELAAMVRECDCEPEAYSSLPEAVHRVPRMGLAVWNDGADVGSLLEGLQMATAQDPRIPVVVFVPPGALTSRSRALAEGAIDVLSLPPERDEIEAEIKDLLERSPLLDEIDSDVLGRLTQEDIIGQSLKIQHCVREMQIAARSDANVLLLGETGTGKGVLAHGIHLLGRRAGNPFMVVNCPTLSGNLLESELFGHVRGAYTGAESDRCGRFQEVGAGTLLLDEIGFVSPDFQAKLLRVIERKVFQRVGDNQDIPCNARLIFATSVDLEEAAKSGKFGRDLLGRIDQLRITLPPLRERRVDIPVLIRHFLRKHARGRPATISRSAMEILESAHYPMNIRQLENALVGALARCEVGDLILPKHLPEELKQQATKSPSSDRSIRIPAGLKYKDARELACREIDALYLSKLLRRHNGNMTRAVDEAGIDRKTFNDRLRDAERARGNERDG